MGPSGGDATPLDLLFDSDSAAASDLFRRYLNAPDEFEGESNWAAKSTKSRIQQKKNHPIQSPYEKVVGVLSQVCLCSPNLNPEHERLVLYLLLAQK